jgi:hypothetical protein
MQWNPAVRERYQALISALAARFDGRVYGINLPETSVDIDPKKDQTGFDCDATSTPKSKTSGTRASSSGSRTWCSTSTSGPAAGAMSAATSGVSSK